MKKKKSLFIWGLVLLALTIWFLSLVPNPLINKPFSTLIESSEGELLSARIADDGQWRFPEPDSVPKKFETCLLTFEDRYFF